ncbi:Transposase [Cordylochernes scorpioides]|uniref:Transposase n=1 Tax=Cordylochernes scorpioides TaxID=51811 RepID=A0ABY6KYZ5_9ARAC|nr:Transposase [Cordylochernes scorpioides]
MPGHRKRRQFKSGWSIHQIAADTHLGASTMHRLWRRWLEQGNVAIYRNVGATRVTSARVDRRILRQAVAAPQATCTAILQHVQDTLDHSISTRTISRRLVANGLHSCRPLRRLPLTPPNRRQRLEWCRARSTWMTEWHRVVFSDESRFCLSSDSRRVRVWRRRGERSNPAAIVERPTVRQRGIMVWGAIAYDSRSPLLRIQGTMMAQRYVDDVLRPVTLPYLQGVHNALYQQDNARPHTARISQQALQDVQMLPWPPYSPDLSPIEHVWDIIGRRLHALPQPRSEDELWQMVEREWRAIPQDVIRTLIDSLPRRVAACIARSEMPPKKRKPIGKVLPEVSKKRNVRSAETAVQREHRLRINRERTSTSRAAESVGQRENRLQQDRDRVSTSRAAESVGQRENRLRQNRIRVSTSRAAETPQEHTARILNVRERTLASRNSPYHLALLDILQDRSTFTPISAQDSTKAYEELKKSLCGLKKTVCLSPEEYKSFLTNHSSNAYIYGLPKIHKPSVPLRPIIAYRLSPAFPLAKFISSYLFPLLNSHRQSYTISNTNAFIQEITKIKPPPYYTMSSYDATFLYLSLPHSLIIDCLHQFLNAINIDSQMVFKITNLANIALIWARSPTTINSIDKSEAPRWEVLFQL